MILQRSTPGATVPTWVRDDAPGANVVPSRGISENVEVRLLEPLDLGRRQARNRLMFGPHVTNLGTDERGFSDRHVAYYERRARGGCGVIVTEGASVHASDWPYERSPWSPNCVDGWSAIVQACRPHGTLVIASLDHAGGQGSSAYSQQPLLAPSRVPEVNSREVPKWMEHTDIEAVISGFADSARLAMSAGCDGVEINAGQHSLVRQFLSGLTNHRNDAWGADRLLFARRVIAAVFQSVRAIDADAVIGLRLSCDELAPWAGITPEMAPDIAEHLCRLDDGTIGIDYVTVVRGSIFSVEKTRPDFHEPSDFNVDTCRAVRSRLDPSIAVFLQGSVVDVDSADALLGSPGTDGARVCDGVEMTRAQIADPDLGVKAARGDTKRIRPCVLCNQACQVRDARNPIVSCIVEPTSGHESRDSDWYAASPARRRVLIVGSGPAGLESARVAALRGHDVRVIERAHRIGGLAAICGPAGSFIRWQVGELEHLGVEMSLGTAFEDLTEGDLRTFDAIVQATGSLPGRPDIDAHGGTSSIDDTVIENMVIENMVIDVADVHRGTVDLPDHGSVVILDPIGGPIGIALAESLGDRAVLVTPDNIAGNELSRTGDLAPANVRLARLGATIRRRSVPRSVTEEADGTMTVVIQDRFSGEISEITCSAVVDAGFRLPTPALDVSVIDSARRLVAAGDCVAPRTVLEAVLEGRRAGAQI